MKVASVSHIVSGLTKRNSTVSPMPPTTVANASVARAVTSPRGNGRCRVRAISASSFCSTRQLIAAAEPATSAMPIVAQKTRCGGGSPGTARNMPMTAQNTISDTTRGFASATKWRNRVSASVRAVMDRGTWGHAAKRAILASRPSRSPDVRRAQHALEVLGEPPDVGIVRIAQHRIAVGIDEIDRVGSRRKGGERALAAPREHEAELLSEEIRLRRIVAGQQVRAHAQLLLGPLHRARLPRSIQHPP